MIFVFLFFFFPSSFCVSFLRLPIVSDCPAGQSDRIASNLHSPSSSSTMAVSRVPSPPLPEVNTPVAENWCYTQASISNMFNRQSLFSTSLLIAITHTDSIMMKFNEIKRNSDFVSISN